MNLSVIGLWPSYVNGSNWRFKWGEISFKRIGLVLDYSIDAFGGRREQGCGVLHIHLLWPSIFIHTPEWLSQFRREDDHPWFGIFGFNWAMYDSWHIYWKGKCHIIDMPYSWHHVRHTFLNPDGSVQADVTKVRYNDQPEPVKQTFPYTYTLKNGEVQNRTATINGEEREWRWKALKWLPFPRKISRVIDIEFNDEVGERSGSWKGGAIVISSEWKRGESMEQALRRCEATRKL